MHILDDVDAASLRSDIPDFRPGDTVKVHVNIIEGTRSRIQVFQGVVIARQNEGVRETFTVRKVSFQVGVERMFPVHSPVIDHIEIVTRGDVRRARAGAPRPPTSRRLPTAIPPWMRPNRSAPGRSAGSSPAGGRSCATSPSSWS